jgi:hypothetical protein
VDAAMKTRGPSETAGANADGKFFTSKVRVIAATTRWTRGSGHAADHRRGAVVPCTRSSQHEG